jgi:RNA polymerase sigma-70 factor (ECF subfamily)
LDSRSDQELVMLCLHGDTEAYGTLVERYQQAVYATAFYYVGRHGAAEDIAQDAYLTAYRSLPALRDPDRFAPWLKEIACRTAANWLRKHGLRIQNETPLPHRRTIQIEDVRQGPEALMERQERFERVQRAIEALPERYRLPVVLRHLQELSYDEIAAFTGQTRDEVRGILQRAGDQLRELLREDHEAGKGEGNTQWPGNQK